MNRKFDKKVVVNKFLELGKMFINIDFSDCLTKNPEIR